MTDVLVLMSTYNGEKYIEEQIESIFNQIDVNVYLLIRDDGSTDGTEAIIEKLATKFSHIKFYRGNNLKPAKSFITLLKDGFSNNFDYYAFSDQDDIWLNSKLSAAVELISPFQGESALYFSSATLVDSNLQKIGEHRIDRVLSFEESLFRNNAQGSTMVLNANFVRQLMNKKIKYIYMHDMWINIVAQIMDIHIIADRNSYLLYRQHENNVLGSSNDLLTRTLTKIRKYKEPKSNLRRKMIVNIEEEYAEYLTENQIRSISILSSRRNPIVKLRKLQRNKAFWQGGFPENMAFVLDLLLDRY